ncbi:Light-mediated development protein DET1 [Zea mays]|uniref:Light-mediated development protein DET1 n=1 Tax=Zea mays TaxID=4577 RepID=A0A1D6J1L8_MAIZE|nr:Light-mediated development protein DET1 [Zea mays]
MRVQHLKKKFYFHFQDYVDLIIWKLKSSFNSLRAITVLLARSFSHKTFFSRGPYSMVVDQAQFLDRQHLFVKFGSVDGGVSRSTDQNLAFFVVYNMETTDIVSVHQNSSEDIYAWY